MSKQTKKSPEQLSPQSPVAPAALKKHGHQHGIPGAEGKREHQDERYVGDVGDNMPYRTNDGNVADGELSPTSEAQRAVGTDAKPSPKMRYSGRK